MSYPRVMYFITGYHLYPVGEVDQPFESNSKGLSGIKLKIDLYERTLIPDMCYQSICEDNEKSITIGWT